MLVWLRLGLSSLLQSLSSVSMVSFSWFWSRAEKSKIDQNKLSVFYNKKLLHWNLLKSVSLPPHLLTSCPPGIRGHTTGSSSGLSSLCLLLESQVRLELTFICDVLLRSHFLFSIWITNGPKNIHGPAPLLSQFCKEPRSVFPGSHSATSLCLVLSSQ